MGLRNEATFWAATRDEWERDRWARSRVARGLETTLSPAHVVKKGPTRFRGCRPALAIQKLEDVKAVTNQASFRSEPLVPWVASGSDKGSSWSIRRRGERGRLISPGWSAPDSRNQVLD